MPTLSRQPISEANEQMLVVQYLKLQYPNVIFNCDMSGIKLSIGQAVKQKKLGMPKGYPDLFIAEPNGKYHGLFIELKKSGTKLFKRDGKPVNEHIEEQNEMLDRLQERGYYATFCIGFDEAKQTIDNYFKKQL
jgi:hypothetical protein